MKRKIKINQIEYEVNCGQFISGAEILRLSNSPDNYAVWIKNTDKPDELLLPSLEIDFEEPNQSTEFFTGSLYSTEG